MLASVQDGPVWLPGTIGSGMIPETGPNGRQQLRPRSAPAGTWRYADTPQLAGRLAQHLANEQRAESGGKANGPCGVQGGKGAGNGCGSNG